MNGAQLLRLSVIWMTGPPALLIGTDPSLDCSIWRGNPSQLVELLRFLRPTLLKFVFRTHEKAL